MAKGTKMNIEELKRFSQKLEKAASVDLKKQYAIWLETIGLEFLNIVQDEIIRLGVVDTRRLLKSFDKSDSDCVFEMNNRGLSLAVGTNVEYAVWVNDGHYVGSKKLTRKTKTGRKLALRNIKNWVGRRKWVEGYHYFDISKVVFETIIAASMEKKVSKWLNEL